MRGWRAYYADGRRIASTESSWADLPGEGLVGVVVFLNPPYRRIVDGGDWTWMSDGEIHVSGTTWGGFIDPPDLRCRSCVKRGAAMPDEEWRSVQAEMLEDRRWPR